MKKTSNKINNTLNCGNLNLFLHMLLWESGDESRNSIKVNAPDLFRGVKSSDSNRSKNMSSGGEMKVASVLLHSYTYKIQLQR